MMMKLLRAGLAAFACLPMAAMAQDKPLTGVFVGDKGWVITRAEALEGCEQVSVAGAGVVKKFHIDEASGLAALRVQPRASQVAVDFGPPRLEAGTLLVNLRFLRDGRTRADVGRVVAPFPPNGNTQRFLFELDTKNNLREGLIFDERGRFVGMILTGPRGGEYRPLRAGMVALFARSRGIALKQPDSVQPMGMDALVRQVRPNLAQVICKTADAPLPDDIVDASPEAFALAFVDSQFDAWSSPNPIALNWVKQVYTAPKVSYYGRDLTGSQVVADKRSFVGKWAVRSYTYRPDSLKVACKKRAKTCTVSGIMDFFAYDPSRDRPSTGVASFTYTLDLARGAVIAEGGDVISRGNPDPAEAIARWDRQHEACRSLRQDCANRDYTATALKAAGLCYGRLDEPRRDWTWHRCGAESRR